jgi:hypothetical protein
MPDAVLSAGASGLTFDSTLDVGTFLTFVALVVGFLGWAYKAIKEWRRDARRAAESGALRLLLKILREHYARGAGPMSLSELRAEFERPGREQSGELTVSGTSTSRTTTISSGPFMSFNGSSKSTSVAGTRSFSEQRLVGTSGVEILSST